MPNAAQSYGLVSCEGRHLSPMAACCPPLAPDLVAGLEGSSFFFFSFFSFLLVYRLLCWFFDRRKKKEKGRHRCVESFLRLKLWLKGYFLLRQWSRGVGVGGFGYNGDSKPVALCSCGWARWSFTALGRLLFAFLCEMYLWPSVKSS